MILLIEREDGGITLRHGVKPDADLVRELEIFNARQGVSRGLSCRFVDEAELPSSRNYRNAWKPNLTIDLEKAKLEQLRLIKVAAADAGVDVSAEIDGLDINGAKDLTELYNKWPLSIEKRTGQREYVLRG